MRYVTDLTHAGYEPRYSAAYIRTIKEANPMQTRTISRAALIQSIEAGIAASRGGLTTAEKIGLRLVGVVATETSVALFDSCPLGQIGIDAYNDPDDRLLGDTPLTRFYEGFDRTASRAVTGDPYGYCGHLTVVE